ncbi:cupredoxin domain-containing protein [Aneurinibacillus terranovensis]|uniref:cupredoxin domain-containing protein n=1 Tax=Aneurinibacillus terranovensis TaxID=278991 RepID=UPI000684E8A2|nr:cupredoxin domain-containing protein [Aneurinibacillus terranovensis]
MKIRVVLPIILLLLNAAYYVYNHHGSSHVEARSPQKIMITNQGFLPNRLTYKVGDTISISIHNIDIKTHNFVLKDFYIFTPDLTRGGMSTVTFQATKKGHFPFISDANGIPEPGYKGELVIN